MLISKLTLITLALLMALLSVAILRKQLAAKNCPVHNRWAGFVAILIAVVLMFLSLGVAAIAILEFGH
ncbi:MAG: hypothetical protein NXI32_12925 [bacterium]|nr:hypothetical protein [bacterium]